MTRINVQIDDALHRRIRMYVIEHGHTVKEFIDLALKEKNGRQGSSSKNATIADFMER